MNSRISINGELATVRFVGTIPQWPNQEALGIEYDNAERGKNNGTLEGIRYFCTRNDMKSGSFIKSRRRLDPVNSFSKALEQKYGVYEKKSVHWGSKEVESFGFEKLSQLQSNLSQLSVVSLSREGIVSCGDQFFSEELVDLDLSFNLLHDVEHVMAIVLGLPHLKLLNLTGNRLRETESCQVHNSVTHLVLSSTFCVGEWIFERFPNLEYLDLSHNEIDDANKILGFAGIQELVLSHNNLKHLGSMPESLVRLNVSHNDIHKFEPSPCIKQLDISCNNILSWKNVDQITVSFPHLTSIRLFPNPLFSGDSLQDSDFALLVGMLPSSVRTLDGSSITSDEKENFELYYISQVNGGLSVNKDSQRWKQLAKKYNVNESAQRSTLCLKDQMVTLCIKHGETFSLDIFPRYVTVEHLKGMISARISRPVLHISLYYYIGDVKEYICDDLRQCSTFSFEQNQAIYLELDDEPQHRMAKLDTQ